jgi:hypothetical protein
MKVQLDLPHVLGSSASLIASEFPHNSHRRGLRPSLCPTPNPARVATWHTKIRRLAYVLRPSSILQSDQSSSRVPPESSLSHSGPAFLLPLPAYMVRLDRLDADSYAVVNLSSTEQCGVLARERTRPREKGRCRSSPLGPLLVLLWAVTRLWFYALIPIRGTSAK